MVSGDLRGAGSTPSLVNQVATYLVGSDSLIKDTVVRLNFCRSSD